MIDKIVCPYREPLIYGGCPAECPCADVCSNCDFLPDFWENLPRYDDSDSNGDFLPHDIIF